MLLCKKKNKPLWSYILKATVSNMMYYILRFAVFTQTSHLVFGTGNFI